jgi:hypothetical protein
MAQNASLKRVILLGIFSTPFVAYLSNFHPPYFALAHIPSVWLGVSRGVAGIVAMIAAMNAHKLESVFGVGKGTLIATVLPGIFYLLMSVIFNPIVAGVLFVFSMGFMSVQEPIFADYYNRHIKKEVRATTLSAINMFSSFYIACMGLIIGSIADVTLPGAFIFMGLVIMIGSVMFRIDKRHV